METFSVKFTVGSLDLDAIITEHDHHRQFKVEMVTNEKEPILLTRSSTGSWNIVQRGLRNFSDLDFQELENAIEQQLEELNGVKHMLVLTDFSDAALNAARYAAALTRQLKTTNLILYHSYEWIILPPMNFASASGEFTESADESLEKIMDMKSSLEDLTGEQTDIEIRTDERTLVAAVNTLVQQQHIGLVVAGITGKSSLERTLVGSNTASLAKDCQAPLLIVPPGAAFRPIKTVVFACDLKRISASTPALAIKTFVHALNARLLILNVDRNGAHFDPGTINEMADLHRLWDEEQPEYHYIDHEDTVAGIMEFVSQQRAELVITVPKEYGFFEGIFHRSMTKKLAYHSHLPLLLFKEDG